MPRDEKYIPGGCDFTRYVFVTTDPAVMASLVGQKIRGMTEGFGYEIESFDGEKQGVMRELREQVVSPHSLRDLPLFLKDYLKGKPCVK